MTIFYFSHFSFENLQREKKTRPGINRTMIEEFQNQFLFCSSNKQDSLHKFCHSQGAKGQKVKGGWVLTVLVWCV